MSLLVYLKILLDLVYHAFGLFECIRLYRIFMNQEGCSFSCHQFVKVIGMKWF